MKSAWLPRVGAIMSVLLACASLAQAQGTQLLVANVQAQQRPFTAVWDVTYDLETIGDVAVAVTLWLSTDSGTTYPNPCMTVSGDIGTGILPGSSRHIVWDAGTDYPGLSSPACRLRVTADDGQGVVPAGFVAIPPGTFLMGSQATESERGTAEDQHQVTLTRGFHMQATEVTNQQYRDLVQWAYDRGYVTVFGFWLRDNLHGSTATLLDLHIGPEISFSAGVFSCVNPTHPVKDVTWYGSVAYCDWLSLQQDLPRAYDHGTWQCNAGNPYAAAGYRLPTEAEWEYSCRAGTQTPFSTGSCLAAGAEANFRGDYGTYTSCPLGPSVGWTVPVGSYPANAFGLHDMHGNLGEWCNDYFGAYGGDAIDPVGSTTPGFRVYRGGGWFTSAAGCRSAARGRTTESSQAQTRGFRPVKTAF